jgi:hypothetical protein
MHPEDAMESMLALASAVGPFTSWLARRLWTQAAHEASWDCQQLFGLARSFSSSRLEAAIARLMYYGVEDLGALRFVLEQNLDQATRRYDADLDGQLHLSFANPQL